jgi:alcohol dehydrogenase class IV
MPTAVVFGPGVISGLGGIVRDMLKASRPLLVTDKGVGAAGITSRIIAQSSPVFVFDDIEPNPKHRTVDRGGEIARQIKPDLIIGLGGGSALDTAKAIAILATNPG